MEGHVWDLYDEVMMMLLGFYEFEEPPPRYNYGFVKFHFALCDEAVYRDNLAARRVLER